MCSNPSTVYWMDIFSHLFVVTIVMFVWKDENKRKDPRIAHFLNEKLTKQGPDPRMFSVNFLCVELMILNWLKNSQWKYLKTDLRIFVPKSTYLPTCKLINLKLQCPNHSEDVAVAYWIMLLSILSIVHLFYRYIISYRRFIPLSICRVDEQIQM